MGAEFWQAAGQIFGTVASVVIIVGAFRVGGTYKGVVRDVAETKSDCKEIKSTLGGHTEKIQTINHTLHGPLGENGMYGAVRDLQECFRDIEKRIGPPDRRKVPRVVKNDRRRKTA